MRTSKAKGFTLVEIMIVVAIIGILIAIAVPGFIKARREARRRACQENLSKIDGAKQQWALDLNKAGTETPDMTDLVEANRTGYLQKEPICPGGGTYTINTVDTDPTCTQESDTDAPHLLP